jgi:hypothetical protein
MRTPAVDWKFMVMEQAMAMQKASPLRIMPTARIIANSQKATKALMQFATATVVTAVAIIKSAVEQSGLTTAAVAAVRQEFLIKAFI